MLLRFSCENFLSIKERQELSFVAAPAYDERADSLIVSPAVKQNILPTVAVYGANASGKSNILLGLRFIVYAIAQSQTAWGGQKGVPVAPFLLDQDMAQKPSVFEVDFVYAGVRYHYGFACTPICIEREWLYAFPAGKKQNWFERVKNEVKFNRNIKINKATISSVLGDNSLVLSAAVAMRQMPIANLALYMMEHWRLLGNEVNLGHERTCRWVEKNTENQDSLSAFLVHADTGLERVQIEKKTGDEKETFKISFLHRDRDGKSISFDGLQESKGTRRLFELAGHVFEGLDNGGVLVIDEIETSLHPALCQHLINLFADRAVNKNGAQLLFTTHSPHLLNTDVLRRDEIWFTEKGQNGATTLYPLSDIKVRKEANLEKGYLDGRFGGVPYLDDFSSVFLSREAREERESE